MEEDTRVEEDIYPAAARILHTNETLHERWNEVFGSEGSDEKFVPFRSEMDWRFVEWTIKSGMGHKQLDRLLGIPGVSILDSHVTDANWASASWLTMSDCLTPTPGVSIDL